MFWEYPSGSPPKQAAKAGRQAALGNGGAPPAHPGAHPDAQGAADGGLH